MRRCAFLQRQRIFVSNYNINFVKKGITWTDEPMNKKIITDKAPTPVGAYPHARRVGNLLFLSGIGPREAGTNNIPGNEYNEDGNVVKYDIAAQCHSVFQNVQTVLEASGSNWSKLVDVTVFLTNM